MNYQQFQKALGQLIKEIYESQRSASIKNGIAAAKTGKQKKCKNSNALSHL